MAKLTEIIAWIQAKYMYLVHNKVLAGKYNKKWVEYKETKPQSLEHVDFLKVNVPPQNTIYERWKSGEKLQDIREEILEGKND